MLDEAGELRPGDRRLCRFNGVEDGERPESIGGRPGRYAVRGLRHWLAIERRFARGGEIVPKGNVLSLLLGVLAVARGGGRASQSEDRMPVLAGVEGELLPGQFAALPTLVEGVLQDVPALPGLVDTHAKFHLAPSLESDPAC